MRLSRFRFDFPKENRLCSFCNADAFFGAVDDYNMETTLCIRCMLGLETRLSELIADAVHDLVTCLGVMSPRDPSVFLGGLEKNIWMALSGALVVEAKYRQWNSEQTEEDGVEPPIIQVSTERYQQLREGSYQTYLQSVEWKQIRGKVLEAAGSRCQLCNKTEHLNVHHRSYENARGRERLGDLTVLCKKCHSIFHGMEILADVAGQ